MLYTVYRFTRWSVRGVQPCINVNHVVQVCLCMSPEHVWMYKPKYWRHCGGGMLFIEGANYNFELPSKLDIFILHTWF